MVSLLHWLIPWELSFAVIVAAALASLLYVRGCVLYPPPFLRRLSFWLGLLSIYAALHTQFDYYSEHMFFMHRIQHGVLHHVGPFLIALARPGAVMAEGMPVLWRREAARLLEVKPLRRLIGIANHPAIAAFIFTGLICFWLIPPVHFIAMLDWRLYRIMNWSMAINGLMFWNLALNNFCLRPTGLSPIARILMMLAVIPPQIIMGMMLFATPRELYPIYSLCGRVFALSPLADQQIGGFILWVPSAMTSVAGAIIMMRREWLRRPSLRLFA